MTTSHLLLGMGALLTAAAACAQNPVDHARVLSSTPLLEQGRVAGYTVEYEFAGQRYTARTDHPPGSTLPVQVTPMGVATFPVEPRSAAPAGPLNAAGQAQGVSEPWAGVTPEAGVVVPSAPAQPGQALYAAPPVWVPGDHVVYPQQPVAVYPPPYVRAYPPVSLSCNLGYVHGGRGYRSHGWHPRRGWR